MQQDQEPEVQLTEQQSGTSDERPKAVYAKTKVIKKSGRFIQQPEKDSTFTALKGKYANMLAFLLICNIRQSDLRSYFEATEDNRRRYEAMKKSRQAIIDHRPKAKEWVDQPFYYGLKLGKLSTQEGDKNSVAITMGECQFKKPTSVISSRVELESYMSTIANIIESEKIWQDPDMADFTLDKDMVPLKLLKEKKQPKAE